MIRVGIGDLVYVDPAGKFKVRLCTKYPRPLGTNRIPTARRLEGGEIEPQLSERGKILSAPFSLHRRTGTIPRQIQGKIFQRRTVKYPRDKILFFARKVEMVNYPGIS